MLRGCVERGGVYNVCQEVLSLIMKRDGMRLFLVSGT